MLRNSLVHANFLNNGSLKAMGTSLKTYNIINKYVDTRLSQDVSEISNDRVVYKHFFRYKIDGNTLEFLYCTHYTIKPKINTSCTYMF